MPTFPLYKCHKEVRAVKIKDLRPHGGGVKVNGKHFENAGVWIIPEGDFEAFDLPFSFSGRNPRIGGYVVFYEDGYVSFSPAAAFEEGYSVIEGK